MLWGVRECLCLASADSQSWCVFLHFAVEEAETPPAHVAEVTGSLTRSTQPAPYYELCLPFPLRIKIFLQNNIAHPEWVHKRLSTISVVTLGLKMLPFAISLLSSENSHLYNIHHLKRFVALLSDFFFLFLHRVVILLPNAKYQPRLADKWRASFGHKSLVLWQNSFEM